MFADDHHKRSEVDFERISILYRHAPTTLAGVLVAFATLLLVIWDSLSPDLLLLWSGLVMLSLLPRILLMYGYHRELRNGEPELVDSRRWEKLWAAATAFLAVALVSLAYFPFQSNELLCILFIAMMLLGMDAGSIISSNTSFLTVMVFFNLTCLPFIVRCFLQGEYYYNVLGGFFSIFYLVFYRFAHLSNQTITRSIELQYENKLLSLKDSLTGLWNRRSLHPYVDQLIRQKKRNQETFSVVLLDVDHFKQINDTHGHCVGDEVLRQVATCITHCSREGDLVIRYGGEEFLVIMPSSDIDIAASVAERILRSVKSVCNITVSAGVAAYTSQQDFDELIREADRAMYIAKNDGRNRVVTVERKADQLAFETMEP